MLDARLLTSVGHLFCDFKVVAERLLADDVQVHFHIFITYTKLSGACAYCRHDVDACAGYRLESYAVVDSRCIHVGDRNLAMVNRKRTNLNR